jgi:hypothetical protein
VTDEKKLNGPLTSFSIIRMKCARSHIDGPVYVYYTVSRVLIVTVKEATH